MYLTEVIKKRLIECLLSEKATHLVCSGACGADLVAMQAAEEVMIGKTMILPFDPDTFRSVSVEDRPGDWGLVYDKFVRQLKGSPQFIELNLDKNDPKVFEKTNFKILDHAEKLNSEHESANQQRVKPLALIVWEGSPKEANDTTYHFMQEAQKRDFRIKEIKLIK